VVVSHHVFNAKVFQSNQVVPRNQPMRDFVQKILTAVWVPLVMPLQLQDSPAGDADGLDCADNPTMPAHGDTSDAADFEPPPIYLKTVAEFFQAKGVELVLAFVPRIAKGLTRLNTAEEVLKRFIQVGGDHLQNVGERHLRLHGKRVQVRQRVFPCRVKDAKRAADCQSAAGYAIIAVLCGVILSATFFNTFCHDFRIILCRSFCFSHGHQRIS
jgi:hypothetical protein